MSICALFSFASANGGGPRTRGAPRVLFSRHSCLMPSSRIASLFRSPHPSLAFFLFFPCMIERIHRRLLVFVSKKVFVFMLQPIRDRNSLDHDAGLKTDAPLEWRKSGNRPAVIRSGRREGRSAPSVVRWQRPCSAESRRSTGWLRAASACAWSGK